METWWHDLRHGLRVLVSQPAFAAVAVASLALGIGANTAIFSVTNALLLRPLPYEDADRIAILWQRSPGLGVQQDWFSTGQYLDIRTDNQVFTRCRRDDRRKLQPHRSRTCPSASTAPACRPRCSRSSARRPPRDECSRRTRTSQASRPSSFSATASGSAASARDPSVVGKSLTLNGNTFTIVGVMASDFVFNKEIMPAVNGIQNVDLLLPLPLNENARANRGGEDFNIFAKLKPGVTLERAQADMNVLATRMKRDYPQNYPPNGGLTVSVVPLINQVVGDVRLALYVLLGAVGSRAAHRLRQRREPAALARGRSAEGNGDSRRRRRESRADRAATAHRSRTALGVRRDTRPPAGRRRRQRPRPVRVGEDSAARRDRHRRRVLAFTFGISLITGIVFGLVPALRASRLDLNDVLREGGRSGVGSSAFGLGHHQLRKLLISAEIALSLVLLIGAGLLIRSYQRITNANPGFDPANVLSVRVALPGFKYNNARCGHRRSTSSSRTGSRRCPAFSTSGRTICCRSAPSRWRGSRSPSEGYVPKAAGEDLIIASSGYVSPDYFRAMGMPLLKGRYFDERDVRGAPDVAIVDDKLAERFWPNEDPIGKRMRRGDSGPWRTVVGVVADTKEYEVDGEPPITAFYPNRQLGIGTRYLVIKTRSDAAAIASAVTREVQALDADLPVYDVNTMDERLADSLARRRLLDVPARRVRGVRVAVGGDRDLWCRELLGESADARARHPCGARCAAVRHHAARHSSGGAAGGDRHHGRPGGGVRPDARDGEPAVRRQRDGRGDIWPAGRRARRGGARGDVGSGPASSRSAADRRASTRLEFIGEWPSHVILGSSRPCDPTSRASDQRRPKVRTSFCRRDRASSPGGIP